MKIQEVMTRNVATVQVSDSVRRAAEEMRRLDVGVIPVLDGINPGGILTDRDIAIRVVAQGRDPEETTVGEVMSRELFFCGENDDVESAMHLMEEQQIRRLLVKNDEGRLVGILSLGDLAVNIAQDKSGEVLREISEPVASFSR